MKKLVRSLRQRGWLVLAAWQLGSLPLSAQSQAPDRLVSLHSQPAGQQLQERVLKDVLQEVEKRYKVSIVYESHLVDKHVLSYNLTDASKGKAKVEEVLEEVLKPFQLRYRKGGNNIYIIQPAAPKETEAAPLKSNSKAAQAPVSGRVVDEQGESLPGVTVLLKGTTTGTVTGADGSFTINVPDGSGTLVFSFIGFQSQEVPINNRATIHVKLGTDAKALDEIVVIGYGAVKKSDLTGAVTSVKVDDLPKAGVPSVSNMLAGKAAGLQVNLTNAMPGGKASMQIRGAASPGMSNEPLVVIDGFPVSGNSIEGSAVRYGSGQKDVLSSINPNDIESIEILKDASATAIYGARAANGVILITTKRGKEGVMDINYSGSMSVQTIENPYDMFTDGGEWMQESNKYYREKWKLNNRIAPYGNVDPSTVNPFAAPYSEEDIQNASNTDWFDEIARTGIIKEHNISMRSGTEKTKYLISLNYYDNKGVLKNSSMKRYSGRINLDQTISKWLKFSTSLTGSQITSHNTQLGGMDGGSGILASAYDYPAALPIKDEMGNFVINPYRPTIPNPVSFLDIEDITVTQRWLSNSFLEADIMKGLKGKVSVGFDINSAKRNSYLPKSFLYGKNVGGDAGINDNRENSVLSEFLLTYLKEFDSGLSLNWLGGASLQTFNRESISARNNDFFTDAFSYNNLGAGAAERPGVGSSRGKIDYNSLFSRFMLNYNSKYLLTLTFRADGASNFGEDNKYGYFPSAAFAWRIIEEDFMKNQNAFSDLKVRLSMGQTGNSGIGGSAYGLYSTGYNYAFGNQPHIGVALSQLSNPNLKWETTTEANAGLDVGLNSNRVTLSVDYFNKVISDLLVWRVLPSYQVVNTVASNSGKTQSRGVEVSINSRNLTGAFNWTTDVILSHFKDTWKDRGGQTILKAYQSERDNLHAIFGYQTNGIITPATDRAHMPDAMLGSLNIKDVNGVDENGNLTGAPDGKISEADIVYLGSSQPKLSFGFNNTFEYKNFDLQVFFYGMMGRSLYNANRQVYTDAKLLESSNVFKEVQNRWSSDNPNGTFPSGLNNSYFGSSDIFLEEGNFMRLRNITLGYSIPFSKKVLKGVRVYADANNLFVITNYKGSDPESDSMSSYPNPKTYTVGINVQF